MALSPTKEWLYSLTESISVTGNRLYATFGNVLRIYDTSNVSSSSVSLLSEIKYAGVCIPGGLTNAKFLVSNSNMAAVAQQSEGLAIINASDYSKITLTYDQPVEGLAVNGNTLYVANYDKYIVLDVSNPKNPSEISRINVPVDGIYTIGSIICCVYSNTLDVRDMSGNLKYTKKFTYTLSGTTYNDPISDINFYGNNILVCCRISGIIYVLDSNGNQVNSYYNGQNTASKVAISGNYAIAAFHDYRVEVLDLTTNPISLVSYYDYSSNIGGYPRDIKISGNYFYLAAHYRGVDIVNISNILSPVEQIKIPGYGRVYASTISNDGKYIFHIDDLGFRVIDITGTPVSVAYIDYGSRADAHIFIDRSKNLVYCPLSWGGLKIVNVSDPTNPITVIDYNPVIYIDSVVVYNNTIFASTSDGYLRAYQVNGSTLNEIGNYSIGGRVQYVHDIVNNVAYCSYDSTIVLLDVSNPASIKQVSTISASYTVSAIKVANNLLYAAVGAYNTLLIADVSNPASPVIKYNNSSPVSGAGLAINVDGTTIYMGVTGGLVKLDASDPTNPKLLDQDIIYNGRDAIYVDVYNGNVTAAFEAEGVKLYRFSNCNPVAVLAVN